MWQYSEGPKECKFFIYLFIFYSKVITIYIQNLFNEKETIQTLLQAYISKQKNAFWAKQYKVQQQKIYINK